MNVGGPWFEDLAVGQEYTDAPALTLTEGHAAIHQALVGDRLRLALDAPLAREVCSREAPLAHPNLVCDVAIGQSTGPSRRVRGNLFYRGLVLRRPVFVGDTLTTTTTIVALKQNRGQPTGLAVLRIRTLDQDGNEVLDFLRCPMIPLRDADAQTGHADDVSAFPQQLDPAVLDAAVPRGWRLGPLRERTPAPHFADLEAGMEFALEAGETVTCAPELARLTLNVATAHTDATGSSHGRRLVYGGHTISIAAAHATRAIPALATIVAWEGCDHLGPVFEGDVLKSDLEVQAVRGLADGGLAHLRAQVRAIREDGATPVLDWRFVALIA